MKLEPIVSAMVVGAALIIGVVAIKEIKSFKRFEDTQACALLIQGYESAEGMSPGWYGRTASALIEECNYGFVKPKDFRR